MNIIRLDTYDSNAYLVDGIILVDAGMDGRTVISELEKHIQPEHLETIILTHCHFDHSGGAKVVAKATGAKIAIHEADATLLKDSHASVAKLFGEKAPGFSPDILLKGGEIFDGLLVIHTPGHTPGSICLYSEDSKILFSGDTVFPEGGFGRTDFYGGNAAQLIESIKKLTTLDVSIMYPGHGDIAESADEQIRMALMMASKYSS